MLKVLHVDDEPDIREVTAMALALDPELELRTAASGQEALELMSGAWRPDVVLLDVMMPRLDGPGTLEKLRMLPDHAGTPVIFMTARANAQEQARFLALGAIAIIVKPFDPMSLAGQVRDHLAGSEL